MKEFDEVGLGGHVIGTIGADGGRCVVVPAVGGVYNFCPHFSSPLGGRGWGLWDVYNFCPHFVLLILAFGIAD